MYRPTTGRNPQHVRTCGFDCTDDFRQVQGRPSRPVAGSARVAYAATRPSSPHVACAEPLLGAGAAGVLDKAGAVLSGGGARHLQALAAVPGHPAVVAVTLVLEL